MFGDHFFLPYFFRIVFKIIRKCFIEVTTVDKFRESVLKIKNINPKENNLYYFHFFAPHEPFTWGEEYHSENTLSKSERTLK